MSAPARDPWQALIVDETVERADPFAAIDGVEAPEILTTLVPRHDALDRPGGHETLVAVVGATGGAGATTLSCALALAVARRAGHATLLDLDLDSGDTHDQWGVPRDRDLGDLEAVLHELRPDHLDLVANRHATGVDLLMSPSTPGTSARWSAAAIGVLLDCAVSRGPVIVDVGRAFGTHAAVAWARATVVIVVAPATVRGAGRVRRVAEQMAPVTPLVISGGERAAELSLRAFGRVSGARDVRALPRSAREARGLLSGNSGTGRRAALATLAASMIEGMS